MPSWFFVRCGDAVKEIYHSVFMQHVVFGIPMQDVQQKPLYAPGTPRKALGGGGVSNKMTEVCNMGGGQLHQRGSKKLLQCFFAQNTRVEYHHKSMVALLYDTYMYFRWVFFS